jgi:hypothetical protein
MQIRVRAKQPQVTSIKNVVIKELKKYYESCRPKTGMKYLRLLHNNVLAYKARIVIEYLEAE